MTSPQVFSQTFGYPSLLMNMQGTQGLAFTDLQILLDFRKTQFSELGKNFAQLG